jgi:thioredoxin 1
MKFVLVLVATSLMIFLSSCSSNGDESSSQSVETSQSETPETSQGEESEEVSSSEGTEVADDGVAEKATSGAEASPSKKPKNQSKDENSATASQPGSYLTLLDYQASQSKYVEDDVVLFFNANWCATCKVARDNIESNLDSIPSNLVIVVVDFDSETDLRKKYGVTIQHTFVQIDQNGEQLAKWSGSVTAEQIAEKTV